jgi:hypothetical protein
VHDRATGRVSRFAVEHERQRFIVHPHHLGGVFRKRARVCDHRRHPLTSVARHIDSERTPRHFRGIEACEQRLCCCRHLATIEHVVHAGHRQRRGLVDCENARGGVRRGHQRHVPHPRRGYVRGEAAFADDEAPILVHAPVA